jgi:hypothetical protein
VLVEELLDVVVDVLVDVLVEELVDVLVEVLVDVLVEVLVDVLVEVVVDVLVDVLVEVGSAPHRHPANSNSGETQNVWVATNEWRRTTSARTQRRVRQDSATTRGHMRTCAHTDPTPTLPNTTYACTHARAHTHNTHTHAPKHTHTHTHTHIGRRGTKPTSAIAKENILQSRARISRVKTGVTVSTRWDSWARLSASKKR